jgi:hypothetical protein
MRAQTEGTGACNQPAAAEPACVFPQPRTRGGERACERDWKFLNVADDARGCFGIAIQHGIHPFRYPLRSKRTKADIQMKR